MLIFCCCVTMVRPSCTCGCIQGGQLVLPPFKKTCLQCMYLSPCFQSGSCSRSVASLSTSTACRLQSMHLLPGHSSGLSLHTRAPTFLRSLHSRACRRRYQVRVRMWIQTRARSPQACVPLTVSGMLVCKDARPGILSLLCGPSHCTPGLSPESHRACQYTPSACFTTSNFHDACSVHYNVNATPKLDCVRVGKEGHQEVCLLLFIHLRFASAVQTPC
jgi:hypothetical protein